MQQGKLIKTRDIEIPGIPGKRPLSIYLPPAYNDHQAWPVAFMFDGQNLYEDEGTLAGGWHLHQVLNQRASRGLSTPVVVGIHHGPDRDVEMCPWPAMPDKDARANIFLNWMIGWLYKEISHDLNIIQQPEYTMVGGSSMGGLLALYAIFRHPQIFGKALIMSPALWVDLGAIFPYIAGLTIEHQPMIYLDCGGKEGDKHDKLGFDHAAMMFELLKVKGLQQLMWNPDPEGEHNEQNWNKRLPTALDFLYN